MFLNKSTNIFFPSEVPLTACSFQRQIVHCQHDNLEQKVLDTSESLLLHLLNCPPQPPHTHKSLLPHKYLIFATSHRQLLQSIFFLSFPVIFLLFSLSSFYLRVKIYLNNFSLWQKPKSFFQLSLASALGLSNGLLGEDHWPALSGWFLFCVCDS